MPFVALICIFCGFVFLNVGFGLGITWIGVDFDSYEVVDLVLRSSVVIGACLVFNLGKFGIILRRVVGNVEIDWDCGSFGCRECEGKCRLRFF